MNVLLVWNGPANAAERSILARREVAFLQELAGRGVAATVALCGDAGGLAEDLRGAGVPVQVVPQALPPSAAALVRLPGAAARLCALIRQLQPDVVEATEPMPAIAAGLAARRRERRVLLYRRQHEGGRERLHLASRLAAHLADRTIVSSQVMRLRAAADDRCDPERIEIATTGSVDPAPVTAREVSAARRSLGIESSARVIGAISRLRREKGLDVLIRAVGQLTGAGDVHLVIAGTGPEEPALRKLAATSPVPVHFLGHRDDVRLWLEAMDVVAISSRRESFGRLTLEAMAAGRPIVATRVGGLPEAIVDGETGLLVPPDDVHALAAALSMMLHDSDAAGRHGRAARARFLARYTMSHMATARIQAWERSLAAAGFR